MIKNIKLRNVVSAMLMATFFFSACEDDPVAPEVVPVKAEIKQIDVKNSISSSEIINLVSEDADTVNVTIPQGTDVTQLDLDILVSFFTTISPEPGITDLTNPVTYTLTSNVESREVIVRANVIPPKLNSFRLTSPIEAIARIEGNDVILEAMEGTDLSEARFRSEIFGESMSPSEDEPIDLSIANPTIKVINKDFENEYNIVVNYLSVIEFSGLLFDGTMLPQEFLPGSLQPGEEDGWALEEDPGAVGESVVHFTSLDDDNGQADFIYGNMGLDADPNETTTVFRAMGIADAGEHYFEIAFKVDGLRAKLLMRNDRIEIIGNEKVKLDHPADFDPTQWHIYRVTLNKITQEFKLYLDEAPEPHMLAELAPHDPGAGVFFGDGGSKKYECLIDYIAFEAKKAYAPTDLPLEEFLK